MRPARRKLRDQVWLGLRLGRRGCELERARHCGSEVATLSCLARKDYAMKGLAGIFQEAGKEILVEEIDVPELEEGSVLIRNMGGAVCGSDLHGWRGDNDKPMRKKRFVGGHECAGVVDRLTGGISTDSMGRPLEEGDRVVFPFFFPCQRCYQCSHGEMHACTYRGHPRMRGDSWEDYPYCDGGFAQYYKLPRNHWIFKAPEEIPDSAMVTANCSLTQVAWALHQAKLRFGDTVVVQGAGGLGIYACAIAADSGASQVIAIDGQDARLSLASRCGASSTIDMKEFPTPQSRVERVMELTRGVGADVVVEVVGVAAAALEGLDMVRAGGRYVDVGNISGGSYELPGSKVILNQTQWIGIMHYNPWILDAAVNWLVRVKDKYPLFDLVSHTFPLTRINEAFETAEWVGKEGGSSATRVVVQPWA